MATLDDLERKVELLFLKERLFDSKRTRSCVKLMVEFLRRQAVWASSLQCESELPFPDLASVLQPGVQCPAKLMEDAIRFATSMAESKCVANLLLWIALRQDEPYLIESFGLPCPFAPLVWFFQRGGSFTREHRVFIQINGDLTVQSDRCNSRMCKCPSWS